MVEAVVQFDYAAQEPDELTLQKGDVITEILIQPGGWWQGKLKGRRGMFPDNFVKVVGESDSHLTEGVTHRSSTSRRCKVLFSYHPVNDDELALQVNDIVEVLDEVEEGWWKGRLRNLTGVFPSNFVIELTEENVESAAGETNTASLKKSKSNQDETANISDSTSNHHEDNAESSSMPSSLSMDSDVPVLPPKPVKEICKALYAYKALNDDELSLREGDVITILSKDGQDKGWWKGELHGQIGVFPDNFVQVIPLEEVSKPLRPPAKATNVTTNRVRDSITKPILASGSASPPSTSMPSVSQKKTLETPPKIDEKTSPPGIGRKPSLPPPPLKKPQRSPTGSTKQPISSPTSINESSLIKPESPTPVTSARSPAKSPASSNYSNLSHETSPLLSGRPSPGAKIGDINDSTDGSTLSRFSSSSVIHNAIHQNENGVHNNENTNKSEIDLDCIGRTAMLTHPTASRVKAPRRRPPSSIYAKEDGHGVNSEGMMNGSVDAHVDHRGQLASKAWLEELKMTHTKKQFSQGRTRVMIGTGGSTSAGGESALPEPTNVKPTINTTLGSTPSVVFRNNISYGQRPQSMFSCEKISPTTRPFSVFGTPTDTITLTVKQWTELNEKISRLEETVESQQETFTKTVKELASRLNEETERVLQMQLEIEKLTDLVTQV